MSDFGYTKRAQAVEDARSDIASTFAQVVDRWNESDPRTQRWKQAVARFRVALDRAYPGVMGEFARGNATAADLDNSDILDFLEADPMFFGSGYMKERLLTVIKGRELIGHEADRLRSIVLSVVEKADQRREMRSFCRAAVCVDTEEFRSKLLVLERSENAQVALRANWVLAALAGKFEDIARASLDLSLQKSSGPEALARGWIYWQ